MVQSDPTSQTLAYYQDHAASFFEETVDADMSEALERFLAEVPMGGKVLDWGCGSGRDSKAMLDAGYDVTSTDATFDLCLRAERLTGRRPRCERFLKLADRNVFDGIWACASLLHLPPEDLSVAFDLAFHALRKNGVLCTFFKYGNDAGVRDGRWFTDMDEPSLRAALMLRFEILDLWKSRDVRQSREDELWLNVLAKRRS